MTLLGGYLDARVLITEAGYGCDIDWAEDLTRVVPTPQYVLREFAWVVVNSGFRFQVARKLWPALMEVFYEFDPQKVSRSCVPEGLKILNHPGKMEAIRYMAHFIRKYGIQTILDSAEEPKKLQEFPWIGKVTCWHFAKVLGKDVVKPDVHLQRAAKATGYPTPLELARAIRDVSGDPLSMIDTVLWRYGEQRLKQGWADWDDLFKA